MCHGQVVFLRQPPSSIFPQLHLPGSGALNLALVRCLTYLLTIYPFSLLLSLHLIDLQPVALDPHSSSIPAPASARRHLHISYTMDSYEAMPLPYMGSPMSLHDVTAAEYLDSCMPSYSFQDQTRSYSGGDVLG